MPPSAPTAFSYIRFSDPSQAAGDSLRRQTEAAAAWCERNGVCLDTSLTLRDLGVSAFRGKHRESPDRTALAAFLDLVNRGRIAKGAFLLIENMDRLSREKPVVGVNLLTSLLLAGVRVVQLAPNELELTEDSDLFALLQGQLSQARGHDESKTKSDRVAKAWSQRRKAARAGGVMTRRLPAWVEERGGRLRLVPDRAATVRRIFDLAGTGHGLYAILKRLEAEKVPPFGRWEVKPGRRRSAFSGKWSVSYLHTILSDRRAAGEFQPMAGGRPDGDPIPGYFPRVVSDTAFERARAGAKERYKRPGRVGGHVNVFQGLLQDARTGAAYTATFSGGAKNPHPTIHSAAARSAGGKAYSFPLVTYEAAVLSCLREIDPRTVLGRDDGPDEVLTLSGELARVESSVNAILAEMEENGESPSLFKRLREKEATQRSLAEQLAEARARAAHPLSEAWSEANTLLSALDSATDPRDARLRLRTALRRVVESFHVLVVPRGRDRLAAVTVKFAEDGIRNYLIAHRPARAASGVREPARYAVLSVKHPDDGLPFSRFDLRHQDLTVDEHGRDWGGVTEAVATLETYPLEMIDRLIRAGRPLPG